MRIENQKVAKLWLNPHGTILEGKSIDSEAKKRARMDLENQGASVKVPRHGPIQGFNLFFFASNESKLVCRDLNP
jgi:hypothetical protein